jgi:hypothetical protein
MKKHEQGATAGGAKRVQVTVQPDRRSFHGLDDLGGVRLRRYGCRSSEAPGFMENARVRSRSDAIVHWIARMLVHDEIVERVSTRGTTKN